MAFCGLPSCYKLMIFFTSWTIFFNGIFFRNSISPIIDVLEHDLKTTATGVGTLGSFIYLFYFMTQIPFGIMLQFIPAKYVLPTASMLFGCSLILFSFSTTIKYATILSSVGGIAQGPAWLGFISIMDDIFTRDQLPIVLGLQLFFTYFGVFFGNYIQAYIYDKYSDWRSMFFALGCISIFAAILFCMLLCCGNINAMEENKNSFSEHTQLTSCSHKLNTTNSNDEEHLLSNTTNSESNTSDTTLYKLKQSFKRALCLKWNWLLSLWGFCGMVLINSFNGMWFISYLMVKFEYKRETATLISGSFFLSRAVSAPIIGKLAMEFAKRKIFLLIGSMLYICTVLIIYLLNGSAMLIFVVGLNLISGIGAGNWGLMWALQREYNAYYKCKDTAAGLVNTLQMSAGFVGHLFIGEMLDIMWSKRNGQTNEDGGRIYTAYDYDYALIIIPVAVVGAIISAVLLKETNAQNIDYSKAKTTKQSL